MKILHLLGYRRNLFHFNNMKAPGATPKIQSLLYPFLIRVCHHSQSTQQSSSSLIQYLQASLGFSPEMALSIAKKAKRKNPKNPDVIPKLLESLGFSKTHIKSIVKFRPSLLSSYKSRLAPKIQFFKEKGFSDSDIIQLMISNTSVFTSNLERGIKPLFDLIHSIVGRDEFVVKCLNQRWLTFNLDTWTTNVTVLRSCGVNDHRISKMIRTHPQVIAARPDRLNEAVEMVKGMGFKPSIASFMEAVNTMMSLSRLSWDKKFELLKSLGWSDEEILSAFLREPHFMTKSEEKIKRGMNYFTKELGWNSSNISRDPRLFNFSLEKRIMPRHRFLQFLASKGCIKKDKFTLHKFLMSERRFLDEYVIRYQSKVPNVLQIYQDLVGSKGINTRDVRYQSAVPNVAS